MAKRVTNCNIGQYFQKMGHTYQKGSHSEIWVTLGQKGHPWLKGITLKKMGHTLKIAYSWSDTGKNKLLLENSITPGKITPIWEMGHTSKNGFHLKKIGHTLKN